MHENKPPALTDIRALYEQKGREIFDDSWLDELKDLGNLAGAQYGNKPFTRELRRMFGDTRLTVLQEAAPDFRGLLGHALLAQRIRCSHRGPEHTRAHTRAQAIHRRTPLLASAGSQTIFRSLVEARLHEDAWKVCGCCEETNEIDGIALGKFKVALDVTYSDIL